MEDEVQAAPMNGTQSGGHSEADTNLKTFAVPFQGTLEMEAHTAEEADEFARRWTDALMSGGEKYQEVEEDKRLLSVQIGADSAEEMSLEQQLTRAGIGH